MNPRQHNVRGHLADDARIMPVACQTQIGFVAIGEQRGSTLHVGVYEGFDRGGGIVGDRGEANAAGTRVEIFGVLASRFGLICVALDDFDSPDDAAQAPFHTVARLSLLAKSQLGLDAAEATYIDVTGNSTPDSTPLGSINRARRPAEVASRKARIRVESQGGGGNIEPGKRTFANGAPAAVITAEAGADRTRPATLQAGQNHFRDHR
jgi:hypothetical protein